MTFVRQQAEMLEEQSKTNERQSATIQKQSALIDKLSVTIAKQKEQLKTMAGQYLLIQRLQEETAVSLRYFGIVSFKLG